MTAFVPPLAQRLVDRFALSPVAVVAPVAGEAPVHTPQRANRLWRGIAGLDDGYAFIEVLATEFGLRPDPRVGDWPMLVEAFRVHDPKDNPPGEPDRLFQFVRVTYAEGAVHVALYATKADAVADAGGRPTTELRAGDLLAGDTFAEWGMEPVTAAAVATHGDTVQVTGLDDEKVTLDHDTVVALIHRPRPRHGRG